MALEIDVQMVSPFGQNCTIVSCSKTKEAIVIDAGDEAPRIWARVNELGLKLKWLVNTHGHVDHASGVARLKELSGVPFLMHKNEEMILELLQASQRLYEFGDGKKPKIDEYLEVGKSYSLGEESFKVIFTPGHTPGGVCLNFGKVIFAGDTLFYGSIGRTDLPGGDHMELLSSIHNELLPLPPETIVYCGHGETTTIGFEKQNNPFLN